jgi:hypothetical protein
VALLRGEIDSAAEDVKDTPILTLATECAKLLVKAFRIPAT